MAKDKRQAKRIKQAGQLRKMDDPWLLIWRLAEMVEDDTTVFDDDDLGLLAATLSGVLNES